MFNRALRTRAVQVASSLTLGTFAPARGRGFVIE